MNPTLSSPPETASIDSEAQSQRIFENVCRQLDRPLGSITLGSNGALFVASLAHGAATHLEGIETATLTSVYRELWQLVEPYLARRNTSPGFERKKRRVLRMYRRFTGGVSALVEAGQVESRTAKVFLRTLPSLKHVGPYAAIVRNHEEVGPEDLRANNERYAALVRAMWAEQPEEDRLQSGGFCHFNPRLGRHIRNRIYISARLSADPERVLDAWRVALVETRCAREVYFKVPAELSRRFETIVFYQSDRMCEAEISALLTAFLRQCPPDLLGASDMPTGVPLTRGVSLGPEPAEINTLSRYAGNRVRMSYNQLIASISQLSLELAFADDQMKGMTNPSLQSLKVPAGRYFDEMLRLSGINPHTMVPDSRGGKLPAWAVNISRSSRS